MSKRILLLIFLLAFGLSFVKAQEGVIVYGVFFYSPTCPHCHDVMENHWPAIANRFGENLQVLFVDVTTNEGSALMQEAVISLNLESFAVPQLIIGNQVLVGAYEIPQDAPNIIQAGIETGGIAYPNIPKIETWFANAGLQTPSLAQSSNFRFDLANGLAVFVLLLMLGSLLLILWATWQAFAKNRLQTLEKLNQEWGWGILLLSIFLAFALALSLLFGSNDSLVTILALLLTLGFIAGLFLLSRISKLKDLPRGFVLVLLLLGLVAAGYLSYVEFSLSDVVCGTLGDCNAVQASDYAQIGGVPIGFIGLGGYGLMFVLVLGGKFLGNFADTLLLVLTLGALIFSIYLTFLEPFVIGATCIWCLSSALVSLALFWMLVPRSLAQFIQWQA